MPVRYMYVLDGEYGAKVIRYCTKTVTLTVNQIPAHNHNGNTWVLRDAGEGYKQRNNTAQSGTFNSPWENDGKWQTSNTGSGKSHNNLQPYVTVYMYRRTA